MSDALEKAEAAVAKAENNSDVLAVAMAALELAKAAQAQQPAAQPCEHHHKQRRSAAEWLGIACAVCVGGIGIAFASLALAVLGGVATIVVLVLRDMWRDMKKGR